MLSNSVRKLFVSLLFVLAFSFKPAAVAEIDQPAPVPAKFSEKRKTLIPSECPADPTPSSSDGSVGLTIVERSSGDFFIKNTQTDYTWDGHELFSKSGKRIFLSDLQELVLLIKNSQQYPELNFEAMGVTERAYELRRPALMVNNESAMKLSYSEYCAVLASVVKLEFTSTSHVHLSLKIPAAATKGNTDEDIELSSERQIPWMLPWKVRIGKRSWTTYYPALPRKISTLLEQNSPCSFLVDDKDFWNSSLWSHMTRMHPQAESL